MSEKILTIETINVALTPVFIEHGVKEAILFGSYAKGNARENSDIDIYVDSGLKGLSFFGLLEDMVMTLGKQIDLIDVSQIKPNSKLFNEIKEYGVTIYEYKRNM
ncbi:MAG: nucleotidyltransferase domain-containing protein [Pseudobutyrivibrio ruminis]|uniref:Nucleotidyltransferase domain-containing protein n=1 Tax=Pseudobutyrivibrio ruminis TaxID=46206 RepID=A0A927UC41_9FIRM|nr:nucleotidyltransferase domain-containing protein [Pseudobutyrivibrio ruminis]